MVLERTKEIINSLGVIDVKYKDESVWIEKINVERGTAFVKSLVTGNIEEASISELKE